MKIHQLLSSKVDIVVTNEEQSFINKHNTNVRLSSLDDHEQWVAQNLVRKGIYGIAEDNVTLIKKINEKNT